ncbi:hypothetical protein RhiirA5_380845 [Rhizophagus irregularis]|uniref:Uncharacterized protein n=1 Tax=Rhizophagus irregularis TaxID=588596 RepID=A0A2I1G8Z2_9GLOM|nr:hypothetical protein RhiirA5_380845 [Rhizophagus irregularis]PKY43107.1 hypothetical protein RhiirA4_508533 [Rhizophagus irregularis]CAB4443985.1 unnamed protein product [Rhizophagus irregularis]
MNSNNNAIRECYDYNFSPSQNNRNDELNYQHSSDTISHHNHWVNTAPSGSEFYLPFPDGRIYYVTYTELNQYDIARRLNSGMYTPNYQLQNLIQQKIAQQNCNCNCNCNRQGTITFQPSSFNNTYVGPSNMQNTGFDVSLQQNNYQQCQQ